MYILGIVNEIYVKNELVFKKKHENDQIYNLGNISSPLNQIFRFINIGLCCVRSKEAQHRGMHPTRYKAKEQSNPKFSTIIFSRILFYYENYERKLKYLNKNG